MASWEYMYVSDGTAAPDRIALQLAGLGSLGWEMCGFAAADRSVGMSTFTAFLKRQVATYPPPGDVAAGWHNDPSGRGTQRFWDGFRWSQHITKDGVQSSDYPHVR